VTIHSTARMENLEKSISKHVEDSIVGGAGLPTEFAAENVWWPWMVFDSQEVDHFLRMTIRESEGVPYASVVGGAGGTPGYLTSINVMLDVMMRREFVRQTDDRRLLVKTLDTVKGILKDSDAIEVRNYDVDGLTVIGKLWLQTREPREPVDAGWIAGGWLVRYQWTEQDTS